MSMLGLVNFHQNIVLINGFFVVVFPRKQRLIVWAQNWAKYLILRFFHYTAFLKALCCSVFTYLLLK